MTDRHAGYIVRLAEDIREDDSEHVMNALRLIKGVVAVEPVPADYQLHVATQRVRREVVDKLEELIKELRP